MALSTLRRIPQSFTGRLLQHQLTRFTSESNFKQSVFRLKLSSRNVQTASQGLKAPNLASLELKPNGKLLSLRWTDGSQASYPAVWLRDNCRCEQCFHQSALNRLIQIFEMDLDVSIKEAKINTTSDEVEIVWSDSHKTVLDEKFFKERIITDKMTQERRAMAKRGEPTLWNNSYETNIRRHNFKNVTTCDKALLDLINDQIRYGLTLVENMTEKGQLLELMDSIGVKKITHYGEDFEVMSKQDANNAAYTSEFLGLHVDLPYYSYGPGLQFLHCIDQSNIEGGDSLFCDGFNVERIMREHHRDLWEILKETEIEFLDIGVDDISGQFHKLNITPVFEYDRDGTLKKVTFNNITRDSHMTVSPDKVEALYRALKCFAQLAHSPENKVQYKLKKGECVIVDNHRVLHGRLNYSMKPGGCRFLHGGYIDWDEVRSRRNCLNVKLKQQGLI